MTRGTLETWSSQVKMWEQGHPLTIRRVAYVTLGVKDLTEATARLRQADAGGPGA